MAEYIDREAAIKAAQDGADEWDCGLSVTRDAAISRELKKVPAADVAPVVRCKDCKYWNRERISCEGLARCNTGEGGIRFRQRNDFCSIGARMDGGQDDV